MRSLHPSQPQLLRVHLLLSHLCLLARLLGIAIDPEAQQQGEPRPKPGQPVIRPSRLCLEVKCSASPSVPPPPRRPLQIHPSPTDENRRRILTVNRKAGFKPTFSQLDGEEDLPPEQEHLEATQPANCTDSKPCLWCDKCYHMIRMLLGKDEPQT